MERDARVVRVIAVDGWSGVTWSDLGQADVDDVDAVITEQVNRFAAAGRPWEWKYYSYDRPATLPGRLLARGLVPEEVEALMVAEIGGLDLTAPPPAGVDLVEVLDEHGVAALVDVHDRVFGGDHRPMGRGVLAGLREEPPTVAAVVAMADGLPIAAGRVEFHPGTDFASLWGGGTIRDWRGRGVFRSLVSHRAAAALSRGYRYLQVDASPQSRPILGRLGFVELATTTPYTLGRSDVH